MSEFDDLLQEIDKYDVISFDIFDTLLLRNVLKPVDIFKMLDKKVNEKYKISGFAEIRIKAEADSRKIENGEETSLELIYENIDGISADIKEEIKLIELELEKEFLIANPFMKKVFDYCIKNKKEVICITDMYLPKKFLKEVLKTNGYEDVKVFLSCSYMKQKRDGKLFEQVWKEKKYNKKMWLHIGDNIESDYNQPILFGIAAYHYKKVLERVNDINSDNIENSILTAIVNNQFNNGLEYSMDYIATIFKFAEYIIIYVLKNYNELDDISLKDILNIEKNFAMESDLKIDEKSITKINKQDSLVIKKSIIKYLSYLKNFDFQSEAKRKISFWNKLKNMMNFKSKS